MKQNMTALVAEARKGNQAAYEALYQETKQMVYFTCFGLLKSEADAADQMQETYITAFQKLDTLEEAEKFPGWIKRIAVNKCKDFLIQKKKWFPLFEEEDIPVEFEETNADFLPESYITVQSKRKILQQILQEELSDVQYRTILLYYYDEFSLTEIAELMECSEGTVKSRLHTARERIKEGVWKYEKQNGDKLYFLAALPFLVRLLQIEAGELQVPELCSDVLQGIKKQKPDSGQRADSKPDIRRNQKGGRTLMGKEGLLNTTAGKIIVAVLALLILGGGIAGILIITSHGGQEDDGGEPETVGSADVNGTEYTDLSEEADIFCQIPFTDAATGEDYLSGHIQSVKFYDFTDDYEQVYLVLDDNHNLYKCILSSDVRDIDEENSEIQWDIELLYGNTRLEEIEECWSMEHYNINTGDTEPGADGHKECMMIYGNGYLYRDGMEHDLNAILPIQKLGVNAMDELFIIDTSGNLHYWNNNKGLDDLNSTYSDLKQVGFLNYYEAPLCDELRQGNCIDLVADEVLLSDGRLVYASSPIMITEDYRVLLDVDEYTFEERVEMEGVKAIYGNSLTMAAEDTQGNIHNVGPHSPSTFEEYHEIVPCDYEGEILNIYKGGIRSLLVQTTEGCYYSYYCRDIPEDGAPMLPLEPLTAIDSATSPIKEVVDINSIANAEILFHLEDGTIWGYVYAD